MAESARGASPHDAVEPFYFGEPPLYGCLHGVTAAGESCHRGVVFCHPLGHEYITLHRVARILATQVSRAGLPTLRFDYSGTGDSAGRLADARLEHWVADIHTAIEALRERTGVTEVSLIGVRLGAALALAAAAQRDDIESLALWDPIVWGRQYLRQLKQDHRRMLRIAHVTPRPADTGSTGDETSTADRSSTERLGFRLGADLVEDLRRLEADALEPPGTCRVLLLETQRAAAAPLGAKLRTAGCRVDSRLDAEPHLWRWSEDITRVQLPHSQVRTLAGWTVGEAR